MHNYLVVKILDKGSIALSTTKVYGNVEMRSHRTDFDDEINVLEISAKENSANFDDFKFCSRVATIVLADKIDDAIDLAEDCFSSVLDLKSPDFAISTIKTSPIGYIKNLDSGEIIPIKKMGFTPSMSFEVYQADIQQKEVTNLLLSLKNDLCDRLLRSLHWSRNAKHEKNNQLKILFYWFSIEALFKVNETDNIEGLIRWFLGFPNGKNRDEVDHQLLKKLGKIESYDYWNKKLISVTDEIRIFRNYSTHSGFRIFDFKKEDIELYDKVMVYASSRCQAAVRYALLNDITNVNDFKECVPIVFQDNPNLLNDIAGNIIFSLTNAEKT
jgi:hypothetical protein